MTNITFRASYDAKNKTGELGKKNGELRRKNMIGEKEIENITFESEWRKGKKIQLEERGCGGWVKLDCNGGFLHIHKVLLN